MEPNTYPVENAVCPANLDSTGGSLNGAQVSKRIYARILGDFFLNGWRKKRDEMIPSGPVPAFFGTFEVLARRNRKRLVSKRARARILRHETHAY